MQARRRFAAAALALVPLPALAGSLTTHVPWEGRFVPGAPAEVQAELLCERGGPARIVAAGPGFRLTRDTRIEAGRPLRLALPVRPAGSGRLTISAELPDGTRPSGTLALSPRPRPIDVAGDNGPLPGTTAGYGPVASLTLSAPDLTGLAGAETAALAAYLAACGRLVVPDAGTGALAMLRNAAGCGGRYVQDRRGAPMPPPATVPLPGAPASAPVREIAALLLPYPLLLLLAALGRPGPWLLLIPPLAVLLLAVLGPRAVPSLQGGALGLMQAGDPSYRWHTQLIADGGGRVLPPLPLPPGSPPPRALDGGIVELTASDDAPEPALTLPVRLLERRRYGLTGTAPAPWTVAITERGGRLHIVNRGDRPTPAGWLRSAGVARPVAPLAAGAHTELDLRDTTAAAGGGHPAVPAPPAGLERVLMLPLPEPLPGAGGRVGGSGWLLITWVDRGR